MALEYFFAVKSISLSTTDGSKACSLERAAKHNKRENVKSLIESGRVDEDKIQLNYSLGGATDSAGVVALAAGLAASIGFKPIRKDYVQAIEAVFSLPKETSIETSSYFADCVAWCCDRFGASNILSADVHLDESTPHCHVLIAPIQDGCWVGGKMIDRKVNTPALRRSFNRNIAAPRGLKMAAQLRGQPKAEAVAMVITAIETNHRERIASPLWQAERAAIEGNPAPYLAALGLVLPEAPKPKPKTMAQIFTSPGKGPKREKLTKPAANPVGIEPQAITRKQRAGNPIGIQSDGQNHQSLSCVGIAPASTATADQNQSPAAPQANPQPRPSERRMVAEKALQDAIQRTTPRPIATKPHDAPYEDGYRRVPDESFDSALWQ